jgi:hypothetical protein
MIRIFKLVLLLVVSQVAFGQAPTNYTNINGRYRWIAGMFDSTFHIPKGTAASLRTGGSTNAGALFYNTTDSSVYTYTGTQWIKLRGVIIDTTSLSNRINLKLNISDTASMLSPYARTNAVNAGLALKVNISDTASMLTPYLRKVDTASLSNRINLKLNISDTASMLSPYARTNVLNAELALKVNISDTASMLSPYARTNAVNAGLALKVNISDTSSMLSPYLRKVDTTAMLSPYKTFYPRTAISLTTTGTSGAATYNNSTGVLNIPQYADQFTGTVTSVATNNGTGITGGTITTAGTLAIDTALISTRLWRQKGIDSVQSNLTAGLALKINISDTSSMLSPYLRKVDTASLSNRINLKLNISDTSSMLTDYFRINGVGLNRAGQTVLADTLLLSTRAWRQKGIDSVASLITSGYVPYTGATTNVDLGTHTLTAKNLVINHASGSGVAASITKGGNGEALTISKTSGSGNAMSVSGGLTSLVDLSLSSISNATTDTDRFLVSDGGVVKYRTGSEVLSDIGGQAALTNPVTGTGTTNYIPKFTSSSAIGNSQVFDNGTNVGIGTSTPDSMLTVVNGARFQRGVRMSGLPTAPGTSALRIDADGTLSVADTTTGGGSIGGSGTTNRVAKFTASGTIGNGSIADSSSSVAMTISSAGNVGIGITSPIGVLHLAKDGGSSLRVTTLTNGGGGQSSVLIGNQDSDGTNKPVIIRSSNGDLFFGFGNSWSNEFGGTFTSRMVINNSNNVGIGTTTIGSRLQINGNAAIGYSASTAAPTNGLAVSGNVGIGTTTIGSKLQVNGNAAIGYSASTAAPTNGLAVAGNLGVGTNTPDEIITAKKAGTLYLYLQNTTNGVQAYFGPQTSDIYFGAASNHSVGFFTNGIERARLLAGGGLIIGNGETAASPSTGIISGTGGTGTNIAGAEFRIRGGASTGNAAGGPITFYTSAAGSSGTGVNAATEKMRINNLGNVGIGTTSPAYTLDVNGTGRFSGNVEASGTGNIVIKAASSNDFPLFQLVDSRVGGTTWNIEGGRNLGNLQIRSNIAGGTVLEIASTGEATFSSSVTATNYITGGVANTASFAATGYSLTGSNSQSLIDLAGTWNTSGNPTAIKLNITNTASGATADLMELQVGGTSQFTVDKSGNTIMTGSVKTGAPSGGTADTWKLGTKVASSVVLDDNDYLEVEVGGVAYRVALVNLAEPEPEAAPLSSPDGYVRNYGPVATVKLPSTSEKVANLEKEIAELRETIKLLKSKIK